MKVCSHQQCQRVSPWLLCPGTSASCLCLCVYGSGGGGGVVGGLCPVPEPVRVLCRTEPGRDDPGGTP